MRASLAVLAVLSVAMMLAAHARADGLDACLAVRGERVIAAENADQHRTPASVTKLVVAAAALHHLGPDFRTATHLKGSGNIADGVLTGDLILIAGGDPSWSRRFFPNDPRAPLRQLARGLSQHGIHRVDGDVVIDTSAFPGRRSPPSRAIGELAYGWAATTSGVAIDDNALQLDIAPGAAVGAAARASWADSAAANGIRLDNRMITAPADRHDRGTVDVLPSWHEAVVHLRGEYPVSEPAYRIDVTVPQPELHVGRALVQVLAELGIEVHGTVRHVERPTRAPIELAKVRSPPLAELLEPILADSRNWHADMLLRVLTREITGAGRSDDGLDLLAAFLADLGAGDAVQLDDASGVSPYTRLSPRAVVRLLQFSLAQPWRDVFLDALARPGQGSLRGWPELPTRLRAKTGTGRQTLGLAGVVEAADATPPLVFACLSDHHPDARAAQRRAIAARVRAWARPVSTSSSP